MGTFAPPLLEPTIGRRRVQSDLFMTVQLELQAKRLMPQLSIALAARPLRAGFNSRVQLQFRDLGHREVGGIVTYSTWIWSNATNLTYRRNNGSSVHFFINWRFIYTLISSPRFVSLCVCHSPTELMSGWLEVMCCRKFVQELFNMDSLVWTSVYVSMNDPVTPAVVIPSTNFHLHAGSSAESHADLLTANVLSLLGRVVTVVTAMSHAGNLMVWVRLK